MRILRNGNDALPTLTLAVGLGVANAAESGIPGAASDTRSLALVHGRSFLAECLRAFLGVLAREDLARKPVLAVPFGRVRSDLGIRVLPREGLDLPLLLGEREVHGGSLGRPMPKRS